MKRLLTIFLFACLTTSLSGQISGSGFHELPDSSLTSTIFNLPIELVSGQTIHFRWDFGDGQTMYYTGNKRIVKHTYTTAGWYKITREWAVIDIHQDTVKSQVFNDSIPAGFIHNTLGCDVEIAAPDTINYFGQTTILDNSDTCTTTKFLSIKKLFIFNERSLTYQSSSPTNSWPGFGGSWTLTFKNEGLNTVEVTTQFYDSTALESEDFDIASFYIDPAVDAWSSISLNLANSGMVTFTPTYGSTGFDPNIHAEHFHWSVWFEDNYILYDDSKISTQTFARPGKYVVELQYQIEDTASNKIVGLGLSHDTVVIAASNECHAGFEFERHWANVNRIEFENTSQNLYPAGTTEDFFEWDFGNGVKSTDYEPSYTYYKDGTYVVKLIHRVGDAQYNTVCSDTITKIITIGDGCHASYTIDSASSVNGNINVFNTSNYAKSGSTTVSYQWDFGDGTTSNLAHPTHTYATNGPYQACLTITTVDSINNTCTGYACHWLGLDSIGGLIFKSTGGFTLNVMDPNTVSIEESKVLDVNIYPNPASDFVNVEGLREDAEWTLYNLQGAMVAEGTLQSGESKVNLGALKSGLYIFNIESEKSMKSIKLSIK